MLFMPAFSRSVCLHLRAPRDVAWPARWAAATFRQFLRDHRMALLNLVFLLQQALLCVDAIVRTVLRLWITKRHMLEWETAAESESADRRSLPWMCTCEWSAAASLAIALLIAWMGPTARVRHFPFWRSG